MIVDGIRTLRTEGVKHISLEVAVNNEPAQALYRRFGFAPVAVRKNYYPVTGQDALVMWALRHRHRGLRGAAGGTGCDGRAGRGGPLPLARVPPPKGTMVP